MFGYKEVNACCEDLHAGLWDKNSSFLRCISDSAGRFEATEEWEGGQVIAVSLRIKGTPAVWSFSFLCFLNMWVCGHVWRQGARTHTRVDSVLRRLSHLAVGGCAVRGVQCVSGDLASLLS